VGVSVGNQLDLTLTDFLEHYLEDPSLTTFALYIEGLGDGEGIRLMNLVRRATTLGKPVVIYKAGRTQAGLRAAKGHTASAAGDFQMFRGLLELAGAMVVDSFEELNHILTITTLFPGFYRKRKGSIGVAILTNAGFEKCATADHLTTKEMDGKLHLPQWSAQTMADLRRIFQKYKIDEIVEVGEVLDLTPMVDDDGYYELMQVVLRDPACDVGILSYVPEGTNVLTEEFQLSDPRSLLQYAKKLREEFPDKPLITVIESGQKYYPLRRELNKIGVPAFSSIDSAGRALATIVRQAPRD
jgi:acyl-CoA synthetase (NDP forming)